MESDQPASAPKPALGCCVALIRRSCFAGLPGGKTCDNANCSNDGCAFHLNELDGKQHSSRGRPAQSLLGLDRRRLTRPNDAATMAAPGLDDLDLDECTVARNVFNSASVLCLVPLGDCSANHSAIAARYIYFQNVDDNATVYLNGVLLGQHSGWGQPFDITLDPAWIDGATNYLAVAVQNTGGAGGIYGGVTPDSSAFQLQPPGVR